MSTSKSSSWPLILIALAITGAGISYHFTLNSRFVALEQKLDQNTIALQQYQVAQATVVSAKTEALNNLGKEVDALQANLTPLGKANKDQTDSLAEIRKQIASLGELQQAQQDAQKKLADYAGQLEKIKHDVQMHEAQASVVPPSVPIPAPVSSSAPAPVPAPTAQVAPVTAPAAAVSTPASASHASAVSVKSLVPPRAESAVDIRPAEITAVRENAVRALPVALPVNLTAASDNR